MPSISMSECSLRSTEQPTELRGTWFAPGSAKRYRAILVLAPSAITLETELAKTTFKSDEVRVCALADPVTVDLPDGSSFVVEPGQTTPALLFEGAAKAGRVVRGWERSWTAAILALISTVSLVALIVFVVLPAVARPVAFMVPDEWAVLIDDQVLLVLDNGVLEQSSLPVERGDELDAQLQGVIEVLDLDPAKYQLYMRAGNKIGANAFALPGGTIIVTDELAELAEPAELTAVIAHEVGHVESRHGLQQVLRGSALAVLLVLVGPDPSTIANLASGLPAVFLESGYSREFEREADDFACRALTRLGLGPEKFVSILERLDAAHPEARGVPSWISSHPDTAARISRIREFKPWRPKSPDKKL